MNTPANIHTALLALQKVLPTVPKDSKNPHFKSSYTNLATLYEYLRPHLVANGLTLNHKQDNSHILSDLVGVETILTHAESATSVSTTLFAKPPKGLDPQSVGGCVTYLSRYGTTELLGVGTDDDDGNSASAPPPKPPLISASMAIQNAAVRNGWTANDVAKLIHKLYGADSLEKLGRTEQEETFKIVSTTKPTEALK